MVAAAIIAASIAFYANVQAGREATNQLKIAEQGQFTDRYNAAITNLGSRSIEVRLGGIYALQRLMQDSKRDQPTVVAVLCAFVRDRTACTRPGLDTSRVPTDVQAALTVVGTRNIANDGYTTVVDLNGAQLANAQFSNLQFSNAYFDGADLNGAHLAAADLTNAVLVGADLTGARLDGARLDGARFDGARLINANLTGVHRGDANFTGADLTGAK